MSVSVIIPAYNEEKNLNIVIQQILSVLSEMALDYELIIVDDGSNDETGNIADRLATEESHIRVIHHDRNMGHGSTLKTGFYQARYELITSLPADGQFSPTIIRHLLDVMDGVDVVTSYYIHRADSVFRKILSRGWRLFMRILFGKLPRLQGPRMFRRELLDTIELSSTTSLVNLELIIKASRKECTFKEIPAEALPRLSGQSKVANLKTILKILFEMLELRWRL